MTAEKSVGIGAEFTLFSMFIILCQIFVISFGFIVYSKSWTKQALFYKGFLKVDF